MAKGKKISEVSLADKLIGDELIPFAKNGANGAVEAETIKEYVNDGLDDKYVAKEDGKGLSSNDFTDEDKEKLDRFELVLANDDEIEDGLHQIASSEAYRNELKERGYVVYHDVKFKVKDCGVTSDSFPWIVTEGAIITANEEGELSDHTQKNIARSVYIWFDTILHYQPYGSFIPSKVSELQNDLKYQTEAQLSNSLAILYESLDSQLVDEYTHLDNKKVDKVEGKSLSTNDYTDEDKAKLDGMEINYLPKTGGTVVGGANPIPLKVDSTQDTTAIQFQKGGESKGNVGWNSTWGSVLFNYPSGKVIGVKDDGTPHFDGKKLMYANGTAAQFVKADGSLDSTEYVAKETGKQLSTEDFTTALKQKLEGLTNYDDATLTSELNALKSRLDTLVGSGDVTAVIDTFQEIEAFLQGITNTQTLTGLLQEMKSEIVALCSDTYLPLSGGTISITDIDNITVKRLDNSKASGINFTNNSGRLGYLGIRKNPNSEPFFQDDKGIQKTILHSGLGTSSQFLKADGSVDSTAYMPKSGGTFTGPISIENAKAINILSSGVTIGHLGADAQYGSWLQYGTSYINVKEDSAYWNNNYKIWHEGNDGAGSGLDADTLDGYQSTNSGAINSVPLIDNKGNIVLNSIRTAGYHNANIGDVGWYRVFIGSSNSNVYAINVLLFIGTTYYNAVNQNAILSVCGNYNSVDINQIAGEHGPGTVIDKIRVLHKVNDKSYIDIHYNINSRGNVVYISGIGNGNFQAPILSNDIPEGYTATEFELGKGIKSSIGLNADLLDGKHSNDIIRYERNPGSEVSLNDRRVFGGIDFFSYGFAQYAYINNTPYGDGVSSAGAAYTFGTDYPLQIYNNYNDVNELYCRTKYNNWTEWKKFAFIDSNVASADKLTAKRLINENLNEIKDVNFSSYFAATGHTCKNTPIASGRSFCMQTYGWTTSYCFQIYTDIVNNEIYKRRFFENSWTPWKKMISEDDIASLEARIAALEARPTIASVTSVPSSPNNNTLYAIPE